MGMEGTPKYEPTPEDMERAEDMLTEEQRYESGERSRIMGNEVIDEQTRELLEDESVKIISGIEPDAEHIRGIIKGREVDFKKDFDRSLADGLSDETPKIASGTIDGKEITDQGEIDRLWNKYIKVARLSSFDTSQRYERKERAQPKERREEEPQSGAQTFDL